jgi:hypothetical protein
MTTFIIPLIIAIGVVAWLLRPHKSMNKPRKVVILATAIPPLVLAIAAVVFQLLHNAAGRTWVSDISNICFIVGLGLVGAAILASAVFALARKGEIAKGAGFGVCIAVVVSIIEFGLLEWLGGV